MQTETSFGNLLATFDADAADIALVDTSALVPSLAGLRALRHASSIPDCPVVYFSDEEPSAELRALADFIVSPSATDAQLVKTLKQSVAMISRSRREFLALRARELGELLERARTHSDLACACVNAALRLGCEAAAVMLADETGTVHSAHVPAWEGLLSEQWPTPFVTGDVLAGARADEAFFQVLFDDREHARRIFEHMHPLSAAAMPIRHNGTIVGTLLAFTMRRLLLAAEIEALQRMCADAGTVFGHIAIDGWSHGTWRNVRLADATVQVYQGARARTVFRIRSERHCAAIVAMDAKFPKLATQAAEHLLRSPETDVAQALRLYGQDGPILAARISQEGRITYASLGIPIPLAVTVSGPVSAIRVAGSAEQGTLAPPKDSVALFPCLQFAEQIDTAQVVRVIQHQLRERPAQSAAHLLLDLARNPERVAFAAVTMRSNAADLLRPSALF